MSTDAARRKEAAEHNALAKVAMSWLENVVSEREEEKARDEKISWASHRVFRITGRLLLGLQIFMLVMFAACAGGKLVLPDDSVASGTEAYNMFIGVELMMFVGFGYLMTFMRWYGLGALGFTMLVTAIAFQWAVFTEAFFEHLWDAGDNEAWPAVRFNIFTLLGAMWAISAVLISFGALIGKISPLQLTVMALIELAGHSCNYKVFMGGIMNLADVGGTYLDHMYGAYFGLAVSYMLGKPDKEPLNPTFGAVADIFSVIGTLFLWVYWPSFVAGGTAPGSQEQERSIANTILALSASTVVAFIVSVAFSEKKLLRPVDIQNATLAGGVAIGGVANLDITPFAAIMIGVAAGLISAVGFNKIMFVLEEKLSIHDTCGVHNLHAMPSVVGALASVIIAAYSDSDGRHQNEEIYGTSHNNQWRQQLLSIFFCMGFAIILGLVTGKILVWLKSDDNIANYSDNAYWETADDFGRSLESELAAMFTRTNDINDSTRKIVDALINTSHAGRRPKQPSSHGDGYKPAALKPDENVPATGAATTTSTAPAEEGSAAPMKFRPALQTMLSVSHPDFKADDDDDVDFFEVEGSSKADPAPRPAAATDEVSADAVTSSAVASTVASADVSAVASVGVGVGAGAGGIAMIPVTTTKKSFNRDEGMPDASAGLTKPKKFVPTLGVESPATATATATATAAVPLESHSSPAAGRGQGGRPTSFRINYGGKNSSTRIPLQTDTDTLDEEHHSSGKSNLEAAVAQVSGSGFGGLKILNFIKLMDDASPLIRDFFKPEVSGVSVGKLTLELPFREELAGSADDSLPQGMVAALADHAGRFCAWTAISSLFMRVDAVDMKIDYRASIPLENIIFEAELSKVMGELIGVEVTCWDEKKSTILAVARGLYKSRTTDKALHSKSFLQKQGK